MKVFVVTAFSEGCNECGDDYGVIDVFSNREDAEKLEKQKEDTYRYGSHSYLCDTVEMEVDVIDKKDLELMEHEKEKPSWLRVKNRKL